VEHAVSPRVGYVPSSIASSLATGLTRNVGVVIPFVSRWFFSRVLGESRALIPGGL
jgi:DNA-binding LacI/PurR family transcriptional regulator